MKRTFDFLKKLKSNNNKEWFDKHKDEYLIAKEESELLIEKVLVQVKKFDKNISSELKSKDCMFRIFRDIRFSEDKTPYKTNMGASINPGGRKIHSAGYYIHFEPGNSFVAGGMYQPEPDKLASIRQEIDYNFQTINKIFSAKSFKKYFDGLDEIEKLKTPPKGYPKDHPHLDLLQHKHFIVSFKLKDKEILDNKDVDSIIEGIKAMYPFVDFLRHATGS